MTNLLYLSVFALSFSMPFFNKAMDKNSMSVVDLTKNVVEVNCIRFGFLPGTSKEDISNRQNYTATQQILSRDVTKTLYTNISDEQYPKNKILPQASIGSKASLAKINHLFALIDGEHCEIAHSPLLHAIACANEVIVKKTIIVVKLLVKIMQL